MKAPCQPTPRETGASPFKACVPAGLSTALGLALAAWFSFAPAAQAADSSSLPAAPTNPQPGVAATKASGTATNALPASASTGAEPRPLAPKEWLQRSFPELTTQTPNSRLRSFPPLPAASPTAQPGPPPQAATNAPHKPEPTKALKERTHLPAKAASNAAGAPAKGGTAVVPAVEPNSMEALDDQHLLAIGDRLSFRIVEDEEEPKPLFVTDSGELEVPYIGRFPAVGKSCKELARELQAELQKEYYRHATVIVAVDVMTKSRGKVYLVGPVRTPGPQEIPSDEVLTLSKAILRAGGFTDFADRHDVKVTRRGSGGEDQKFIVNVADILEKGKTESDLRLEPGDLIYVPERLIRF